MISCLYGLPTVVVQHAPAQALNRVFEWMSPGKAEEETFKEKTGL
jgi:hypothetical protein